MQEPKTDPAEAQPPLPLFRPEVLAAQQHKFYGEVLLIRPFSGQFLVLLGFVLAAIVVASLLLGRHMQESKPFSGQQQSGVTRDIKAK